MGKRLLLVSGATGGGKSTLACQLQRRFGFETLGVDGVYIKFVQEKWRVLCFPDLKKWIAPHFQMVTRNWEQMKDKYKRRSFVDEWEDYLTRQIEALAGDHGDKLVVEGWLLGQGNTKHKLTDSLSSVVPVFWIWVDKDHKYFLDGEELTLEQVANLG